MQLGAPRDGFRRSVAGMSEEDWERGLRDEARLKSGLLARYRPTVLRNSMRKCGIPWPHNPFVCSESERGVFNHIMGG